MKIEIDIFKSSVSKSERSNYLTIETGTGVDVREIVKNFNVNDLLDELGVSFIKDYLLRYGYKVEKLQNDTKQQSISM